MRGTALTRAGAFIPRARGHALTACVKAREAHCIGKRQLEAIANPQARQIKTSPQYARFIAALPKNRAKVMTQSRP
jgi:hypothetical protein